MSEENVAEEESKKQVKLEKPFKKLFLTLLVTVSSAILGLFLIGMIMGFMGIRPPTFDPDSVLRPGQSTPTVSSTPTPATSPTSTISNDDDAYSAGKEAGEALKKFKNDEESFWRGFNEASKEESK